MGSSNKTVTLFFFMFCLNLLFSSLAAAHKNPTATPPPPSTHGTPSTDGGPITCIGSPTPPAPPPTGGAPTCRLTQISLEACINLFNSGLPLQIGTHVSQCCSSVQGLVDIEANLCLCAALKASVLNTIPLDVTIALPLIITACGRNPSNAKCS